MGVMNKRVGKKTAAGISAAVAAGVFCAYELIHSGLPMTRKP